MKMKTSMELEFDVDYDYEEDTDISDAKVDICEVMLNGVDVTSAILADDKICALFEDACYEVEINRPCDLAAQREDYEYERSRDAYC